MSQWNLNATCRLIALLAGISFFGAGLWLITRGVSATGTLNLQSALISGKIETGSAGLIIVFLATVIIIFATIGGSSALERVAMSPSGRGSSNVFYISWWTKRFFWILSALLVITLAAVLLIPAASGEDALVALLNVCAVVTGLASIMVFVCLLGSLFSQPEEEDVETEAA